MVAHIVPTLRNAHYLFKFLVFSSIAVSAMTLTNGRRDRSGSIALPVTNRVRVASWPPEEWIPKMIVFDKDGTLGDCTKALKIWCYRMTEKVVMKCNAMNLSQEKINWVITSFHSVIGWSVEMDSVLPSAPLSAGSWNDIIDITVECLVNVGLQVSIDEVSSWHNSLGDIHEEDPPLLENLPDFLNYLRSRGIIISICTSDDRSSTTACLRNWDIDKLVHYSICGDEVKKSKPSSQPLISLCRQAGVTPQDCLVVGDTSSDCGMGINGGAGLVVGVLTGSGTREQLLNAGAHVVLPNVQHLEDMLFSLPTTSSSTTVVSMESDDSISHEKSEDDFAASLLISMRSEGYSGEDGEFLTT